MIPGANILKMALSMIRKQRLTYYKNTGRATNSIGMLVPTYAPPVVVEGSFQPVPRNLYAENGLDFQKDYYTFYAPVDIFDLQRDVSGDQLIFNNTQYQCESNNDWFAIDGWKGVLCVRIGTPDPHIFGFGPANVNFNQGTLSDAG
jgi:hypothetical protein